MKLARSPVEALVHIIHRYFIWLIMVSYAVAAVLPAFGLWIRHMNSGGQWSV